MQAEDNNVRRVGVEEELIKFRPSPNFKNMKKFLKSRSHYSESTMASPTVNEPSEVQSPNINNYKNDVKPVVQPPQIAAVPPKVTVAQPPLPPYPPPKSPLLNVTIKQEKVDVEDEFPSLVESSEGELNQDTQLPSTTEQHSTGQKENRPKKTICKEFIRGSCTRPICRYAHEVDVSQLAGVFTFCWNYQNDVCTYPNCKFVHASVFEEAEFYRTGVLPPHARAHMRKAPQPPPSEEPRPEIRPAVGLANPPPPLQISMEQRPEVPLDGKKTPLLMPRSLSPLKRAWSEIEGSNSSPRDIEITAKKCKQCEVSEISIKYYKEMGKNMIQSSEEITKKIALLNKRTHKLYNVLLTLLKPAVENKTALGGIGLMNGADKENILKDQLNGFAGSNRLSSLNDDFKSILGSNINLGSFMKTLLCSAAEQKPVVDASRET